MPIPTGNYSATSKHPRGSGGRGTTTAGLEAKDGEDNGEPENDALHNGSAAQRFDRGKAAAKNNGGISINGESKAKGSDRGHDSGAVAVARDAVDADSKALNTSRAADNGRAQKNGDEAGASGGRSRNGNGGKGATADVENGAAGPASRSGGGGGRGKAERLSTSQDRGKKRSPEAELETAAEAPEDAGGVGGGDGAGGRARGKVPRGRHSTSARAAASAASTSPTMAVEGSSSGRRTRGNSLA